MRVLRKKELDFASLTSEAMNCLRCPRMSDSTHVIGPASGRLDSPIFIIGEAPGRLGADASAIPFHGDKAGDNFEALLEQVGLSRHDCFITNAAICNPKDENGNNGTPTRAELQNCSGFLKRQIDLVDPAIVVTLGAQALIAIRSIEDHRIELVNGVRKVWSWYGRTLVPLYHPGQRAMIHRSFFNQLSDYRFLAETYSRRIKGKAKIPSATPSSVAVARIVTRLINKTGSISYFALHKLFYLTEYEYYKKARRRMTSAYIVRQKEGPYVFELHIKKLKKTIEGLDVRAYGDRLLLSVGDTPQLFYDDSEGLEDEFGATIDYVALKYGRAGDSELKRIVYLTAPMRHILRREKTLQENMFNKAIDFSVIRTVD
jgi:uracil-DNA glycosylase family 4